MAFIARKQEETIWEGGWFSQQCISDRVRGAQRVKTEKYANVHLKGEPHTGQILKKMW